MQPGFHVNVENYRHIAHICRLVQGMPLAIVLAAAWVETLNLDEIEREQCYQESAQLAHRLSAAGRFLAAAFDQLGRSLIGRAGRLRWLEDDDVLTSRDLLEARDLNEALQIAARACHSSA